MFAKVAVIVLAFSVGAQARAISVSTYGSHIDVPAYGPHVAIPAIAAPAYPVVSSFSTVTRHYTAPLAVAAPIAATVYAAPVYGTAFAAPAYGVPVAHVAPIVHSYGTIY